MNKKLGFYSAAALTVLIVLFAIGILIGNSNFAYFVCLLLSWAYILFVGSFAAEISPERKAIAYGGIAFAGLYAVFIDLVYFTQLTTVAYQNASPDILRVLSYQSLGSLMFNLDLFGYGLMAISTFLIGMAMEPRNKADKWLKALLMIHGVFAPACVLLPMLNIFNATMESSGANFGITVLLVWCVYFIPIGVLAVLHFKNRGKVSAGDMA